MPKGGRREAGEAIEADSGSIGLCHGPNILMCCKVRVIESSVRLLVGKPSNPLFCGTKNSYEDKVGGKRPGTAPAGQSLVDNWSVKYRTRKTMRLRQDSVMTPEPASEPRVRRAADTEENHGLISSQPFSLWGLGSAHLFQRAFQRPRSFPATMLFSPLSPIKTWSRKVPVGSLASVSCQRGFSQGEHEFARGGAKAPLTPNDSPLWAAQPCPAPDFLWQVRALGLRLGR